MAAMPEAKPQDADQGLFDDAIKEVKRLEGLLVPKQEEGAKDKFADVELFEGGEKEKPIQITFEKLLDDTLKIEDKLKITPYQRTQVSQAAQAASNEEDRVKQEQEDLERMKKKFVRVEQEAAKALAEKARKTPEPAPSAEV